jgi:hypothetical protein
LRRKLSGSFTAAQNAPSVVRRRSFGESKLKGRQDMSDAASTTTAYNIVQAMTLPRLGGGKAA